MKVWNVHIGLIHNAHIHVYMHLHIRSWVCTCTCTCTCRLAACVQIINRISMHTVYKQCTQVIQLYTHSISCTFIVVWTDEESWDHSSKTPYYDIRAMYTYCTAATYYYVYTGRGVYTVPWGALDIALMPLCVGLYYMHPVTLSLSLYNILYSLMLNLELQME